MNDTEHDQILWYQSLYPPTRREAIALNQSFYFTGIPCKRGHLDLRIVHSRNCRKCRSLLDQHYRNAHESECKGRWAHWYQHHRDEYLFKRKLKRVYGE
jgi:hypothetical protein